jgi:hypothetical protein
MAGGGTIMPREPFDSSVIRSAGYDPATCTREVAFRNHRIVRYLDGPPAAWMALADAESAGVYCSAHIRTADACRRPVTCARATHQQATPR